MVLCLAVPGPLASACVAVALPSRPGPRRLLGSGFVRAHARPAAPCVSPARSALLPPPPLGRQALSTWPPSLLHPPPPTRGELRPSCLLGDPCHLPHASSLPLGAASLLGQTPHPSGLRRWRWGGGLSSTEHSPTEEALRALGGWGWLVVLYVGRQAPPPPRRWRPSRAVAGPTFPERTLEAVFLLPLCCLCQKPSAAGKRRAARSLLSTPRGAGAGQGEASEPTAADSGAAGSAAAARTAPLPPPLAAPRLLFLNHSLSEPPLGWHGSPGQRACGHGGVGRASPASTWVAGLLRRLW